MEMGTVEASKLADLLLIEGGPLRDISILEDKAKILKVIKAGPFHSIH